MLEKLKKITAPIYWFLYCFMIVLGYATFFDVALNQPFTLINVMFACLTMSAAIYLHYKIIIMDLKSLLKSVRAFIPEELYEEFPESLKEKE